MHNANYSTLARFCVHIIKFNYLKITENTRFECILVALGSPNCLPSFKNLSMLARINKASDFTEQRTRWIIFSASIVF